MSKSVSIDNVGINPDSPILVDGEPKASVKQLFQVGGELRSTVAALRSQIEQSDAVLAAVRKERDTWRENHRDLAVQFEVEGRAKDAARAERDHWSKQAKVVTKSLEEAHAERDKVTEENGHLQAKLDEQVQFAKKLESERDSLKRRLDEMEERALLAEAQVLDRDDGDEPLADRVSELEAAVLRLTNQQARFIGALSSLGGGG